MTATTLGDLQAPAHAPRGFGLFLKLLAANWTWGRLTLKLPDGQMHELVGKVPGRSAVLEIRYYAIARRVLANGDIVHLKSIPLAKHFKRNIVFPGK